MLKIAALPKRSIFDRQEVDDGESGDSSSNDNVKIAKKSRKSKG